jgi:hypothetical protein
VLSTRWPFDALMLGPDRYLLHATLIATMTGRNRTPDMGRNQLQFLHGGSR